MNIVEIIPAILPRDFTELETKIGLVSGFTKTVQIDICDGQFVPNDATWPYRKHDDTFDKMLDQEDGLPNWENLDYEFDLMVNKPEGKVEQWISVGATRVIVHADAKGDIAAALEKLHGTVESGLAINVVSSLDDLDKYRNLINFVQCMGIDHVGFQGQAFDEKVVDKIKRIRSKYPDMIISVDGGVSLDNASKLIAAGANRLVIGSAIFDAENPIDAIQKFRRL